MTFSGAQRLDEARAARQNITMRSPSDHFPPDYRTARANFITACEAAGQGVTTRLHPHASGIDGKPLFIDLTSIGRREAKSALLLISATHGVEGYFGSAIQTGLLREGLAQRVPHDTRIVLLHALNPYGFSWNRRTNEDNVDLNRNFVDHANPPANAAYDELADAISPRSIREDAMTAADAKLRQYGQTHGAGALSAAISTGQHSDPHGVYYGGVKEAWSAAMLRDVFAEEFSSIERLIGIDFHTGLGAYGAGEMISEDPPDSQSYKRAKALWGSRVTSSQAGESVSPPLVGTVDDAVAQMMAGRELTFGALEVGTYSVAEVFGAMRADNWLYNYASETEYRAQNDAIRAQIRRAFYPGKDDWKFMVWEHADAVVNQALAALA